MSSHATIFAQTTPPVAPFGAGSEGFFNGLLVDSHGFLDEGLLSVAATIWVDPANGIDYGYDPVNPDPDTGWASGTNAGTPLKHLTWAARVWNDSTQANQAQSCAIRILRGTDADDDVQFMVNLNRGGHDLTHPLLISTYGSGDRPRITFPMLGQNGIVRPSASPYSPGDFIYINGLFLEDTYTGNREGSVGIDEGGDDDHFVVCDCVIKGFWKNVVLQPYSNLEPPHGHWWSLFRNIIVDAAQNEPGTNYMTSAGIFGYNRGGLVISQNVIDNNGYYQIGPEIPTAMQKTDGLSHNLYLDSNPFVWGNVISRGGAAANRALGPSVCYANVIAENPLGYGSTGSQTQGGGRIARNYFERAGDLHLPNGDQPVGWSAELSGNCGPTIVELNCMTQSLGASPRGPTIEPDNQTLLKTNRFTDGGFETSTNMGWGAWALGGDMNASVVPMPYRDAHSAEITPGGALGYTSLTHDTHNFGQGSLIRVEFEMLLTGGTGATIGVEVIDTENQPPHPYPPTLVGSVSTTTTTGWHHYMCDTVIPTGFNEPDLALIVESDGTVNLDDVVVEFTPAPFEMSPEMLFRNNTTRGHGPFAPNLGLELYPMVRNDSNSWDSRGNNSADFAMWFNPVSVGLLASDHNAVLSTSNNSIQLGLTEPATFTSLADWRANYAPEDANSPLNPTITYPTSAPYDLGQYAHKVGLIASTDPADYYAALRARAMGDYTNSYLIDFATTAQAMIKANQASIDAGYTGDPNGPMPYFGAADGSEPQFP